MGSIEANVESAAAGKGDTVVLKVFRGTPEGGEEQEYRVPTFPGIVVLDAIHYVQAHYDSSLACRWNCKAGKCGSCSAEINGKPRLLCKARVRDFAGEGGTITVHPLKAFPLIKDLVTDVSWNYRVSAKITPFTPREGAPNPLVMQQVDVDRIQEFRKCIECFLCQDVCHILRDHNRKDTFYGPRQLIKLANLDMHPYDAYDRRQMVREESGVGICNITKCCTEVCPEHIHITDNGIIPLKERVADIYFDPVLWAARKITKAQGKPKVPRRVEDALTTDTTPAEEYWPRGRYSLPPGTGKTVRPTGHGGPAGVVRKENITFDATNPYRARAGVQQPDGDEGRMEPAVEEPMPTAADGDQK